MPGEQDEIGNADGVIETIRAELDRVTPGRRQRILEAVALAALGSIPWVGGVLAAAATFQFDESGIRGDKLRSQWLLEHHEKLRRLRATLDEMGTRFEGIGGEIDDRIESEDYLALVRKTFRQWDQADTEEKRKLLVQLITNAAGTRVCSDDILRLFLDWVDNYHLNNAQGHLEPLRILFYNSRDAKFAASRTDSQESPKW